MRKKITTLVLCVALTIPLMAQLKTDSFFNYSIYGVREKTYHDNAPLLKYPVYFDSDIEFSNMDMDDAPVGEGLAILAFASVVYYIVRRKEMVK